MTCIAWDGKCLAADKLASSGGMRTTVTKIHRTGDLLMGGSGEFDQVNAMFQWVIDGRKPDQFPPAQRHKDDWASLLVIEDGRPMTYERTPFPTKYEQRYMAIGSGRDYAMAAMHLGKSAQEAVAVACALDIGCGGGIDALLNPMDFK